MAGDWLQDDNQYMQRTDQRLDKDIVKRYVPIVRISFHTEKQCYMAKGKVVPWNQKEIDPSYQVLSVNTQKSLSNPAGGFTITLSSREWMNRLRPNDLVVIKMGYVGQKLPTVMVGLIDTVSRRRSMSGMEPQVTTTVVGRDFGKLFVKSSLKFYPEIGAQQSSSTSKFFLTETGWINMLKIFSSDNITKGSPAVILDRIMRFIMTKLNDNKWSVYDESGSSPKKKTVNFSNIVRYKFQEMNFFLPFMLTSDQFEGSVWNLMEKAVQKPFTELFIDTRDESESLGSGKNKLIQGTLEESSSESKAKLKKDNGYYPHPGIRFGEDETVVMLVYRETPFDTKNWKKLIKHTIPYEDIISDEISRSDNEHYNLFWAGTTINTLGIDLKRAMPPLINEGDAKKFGLSPLEVQIEGLEVLRSKSSEHGRALEGLSGKYTGLLKAWFQDNHELLSGSLDVRGKAGYKIGQIAYHEALNREFYIEGVNHSFNVYSNWVTSLTVTRGMYPSAVVDSYKYVRKPADPPKPKPTTPAKPKPKDSTYTVKKGDTLWAIAGKYYNKNTDWRRIWEANKTMLIARDKRNASDHGHWIYPGQKLKIPAK